MKQDRYEGRGVNIILLVCALGISFFTALMTLGCAQLWNRTEYGPLIIIPPIFFGSVAIVLWLNIGLEMAVEADGIVYERSPQRLWKGLSKLYLLRFIVPDIVYGFETIEKIRVSGNLVNIRCGWLGPGPILIRNPKGLIEAVKRYAPDKLEVADANYNLCLGGKRRDA